jgi:hypothetical protein
MGDVRCARGDQGPDEATTGTTIGLCGSGASTDGRGACGLATASPGGSRWIGDI